MALIASPEAGQTFSTAAALFLMTQVKPAAAAGSKIPLVASAPLTNVNPVAIAAAFACVEPAAATVALGIMNPALAVTVVPDNAPVDARDAPEIAPVAATVVNDPAAAVVPPMTELSTVPPLMT